MIPPSSTTLPARTGALPMGSTLGSPTAAPVSQQLLAASPLGVGGSSSPSSLMLSPGQLPTTSPLSLSPTGQLSDLGGLGEGDPSSVGGPTLPPSILSRMGNQSSLPSSPASSGGSTEAANLKLIDGMIQLLMQHREDKQAAAAKEEQKSAQLQQVIMAVASRAAGNSPATSASPLPSSSSRGVDPTMLMGSLPGGRSSAPMGLTGGGTGRMPTMPGSLGLPSGSSSPMGLSGRNPIV